MPPSRAAFAPATRVTGSWSFFPCSKLFHLKVYTLDQLFSNFSPSLSFLFSGAIQIQERRFFGILRPAKRKDDGKWPGVAGIKPRMENRIFP